MAKAMVREKNRALYAYTRKKSVKSIIKAFILRS